MNAAELIEKLMKIIEDNPEKDLEIFVDAPRYPYFLDIEQVLGPKDFYVSRVSTNDKIYILCKKD